MALAHIAQAMQDFAHALGHRGLAGARPPRERHVQARRGGLQAHLLTRPIHHQQGSDLSDPRLHWPQTDQLPIQLVQHRLDTRPVIGRLQVDQGVVRGVTHANKGRTGLQKISRSARQSLH